MTKKAKAKTYKYTKKSINKNILIKTIPFKNIESEYEFDIEKSPVFRLLNFLDKADKTLLIIYSELKSLQDTAKYLNISFTTMNVKIREIREKIYAELKNMSEFEREEIIAAMTTDSAKNKIRKI